MFDPTITLDVARKLVNDEETYYDNRDTIISLFMEIDDHIIRNGELPEQWREKL